MRNGDGTVLARRSGAIGSRTDKVHQLGAVRAVDPSVVAPHHPLVLLVSAGRDRDAIAGVCVSALAVFTHNGRARGRKARQGLPLQESTR